MNEIPILELRRIEANIIKPIYEVNGSTNRL